VEEVEFASETKQFLTDAKGRRVARRSEWACYFPTDSGAIRFLLDRETAIPERARREVEKQAENVRTLEARAMGRERVQ
jgi:hypothetical protein